MNTHTDSNIGKEFGPKGAPDLTGTARSFTSDEKTQRYKIYRAQAWPERGPD